VGLAWILVLVGFAVYAQFFIPTSLYKAWYNPAAWLNYPAHVPPYWVNYFNGFKNPPSFSLTLPLSLSTKSGNLYVYTASASFQFTYNGFPSGITIQVSNATSIVTSYLEIVKPDGVQVAVSTGNSFPVITTSPPLTSVASNLIYKYTGTYPATVTSQQVMAALFGVDGKGMFNETLKGPYKVSVVIYSNAPLNGASVIINVQGSSYGLMGTDYDGRPIDLGILMGLPSTLLLAVLTSVVSVGVGVIYGGLAGFLGGRKDDVLQWFMLVVLALPALPFLVTMEYVFPSGLSIIDEMLLIAFLSWPAYAIIARAAAISVRSLTYVEADYILGVPKYRSFFTHVVPRLLPFAVAYTVLGIPGAVILIETLAFLGVYPPGLVSWGEMLNSAEANQAALNGWWWWILFPGIMIVIVSAPFVMVGYAIDKIVSPRVGVK
jgi:peptide/nickel transport system permease protein